MSTVKTFVFTRPVETDNGDNYIIIKQHEKILMGVIDGLGHGKKASEASVKAKKYVENHAHQSLNELIWGCHEAIKNTRGAVMGLARIDTNQRTLNYAGIGDTEACILNFKHKRPISRPGIVGHNIRKVSTYEYNLRKGFAFYIHSDGISRRFQPENYPLKKDPEKAINLIVKEWGKETDDLTFILAIEEVKS
ncbi:SpoIIE family protein phosphatase [Candidatus Bathyarchaeota archaeon]|nr:SpoIIE family protein phosphatase [Candidatus Bathyarchaeota archaeon]